MFCALTLAGMNRPSRLFFCPSGQGPKRTLGSGPLWTFPAPEARSPPLDSTPQRAYLSASAPLLNGVWPYGGWNKFHLAYRMLIYKGAVPG